VSVPPGIFDDAALAAGVVTTATVPNRLTNRIGKVRSLTVTAGGKSTTVSVKGSGALSCLLASTFTKACS